MHPTSKQKRLPWWLGGRASLSQSEARLGFAMVLPSMAILGLVILYPLVDTLILSFFQQDLLGPPGRQWVGLGNFKWLVKSSEFWNAFKISVVLTVSSVSVQMVSGMLIALLLNVGSNAFRMWRPFFIFPWAVPNFVTAFMFVWLLEGQYGALNQVLALLGLDTVPFLGDPTWALPATILVYVWRGLPWVVLVLLAGLQMIPRDLLDAASVDGCSPIGEFVHVIVPHMRHVIVITVVLRTIWTVNHFELSYLLTGGGPLRSTETLPLRIYNQAFTAYSFGKAATIGSALFLILAVFSFIYLRVLREEQS